MLNPTKEELDARERARQAGRKMATQAHVPGPEDQPPAEPGPVAMAVEILRPDPEPEAAPVIATANPQPGKVPADRVAAAPSRVGLPTAVWLVQLAKHYGAQRVGPRYGEPELAEGVYRVSWSMGGEDSSADFARITDAAGFRLDATDGTGGVVFAQQVGLRLTSTASPDSAPPAAETGVGGPTTADSAEGGSTAEKTAFAAYAGGSVAVRPAIDLARAFGAFAAGDAFHAPPREGDTVRVAWSSPGLPVRVCADFETFTDADTFADMLLDDTDADHVVLSGTGRAPEGARRRASLEALMGLDMDKLLRQALLAELTATHRRLNVARWWAVAGWGAALCFGAAAAAMGVALRGTVG